MFQLTDFHKITLKFYFHVFVKKSAGIIIQIVFNFKARFADF